MTIRAHVAVHVEIVEQHELPRQRVLVGRDLLAEEDEVGRAVTLFDVAQDLVVRPVFLDYIDHVVDGRLRVAFGREVLDQTLRLRRSHSPSCPVHLPCQARHLGTQALEIALGYRLNSSPDQVADISQLGTRIALVAAGGRARPKGICLRAARTLNDVSAVRDEELSSAG